MIYANIFPGVSDGRIVPMLLLNQAHSNTVLDNCSLVNVNLLYSFQGTSWGRLVVLIYGSQIHVNGMMS